MGAQPIIVVENESKGKVFRQLVPEAVVVVLQTPLALTTEYRIHKPNCADNYSFSVTAEQSTVAQLRPLLDRPGQPLLIAFDQDRRGSVLAWQVAQYCRQQGREDVVPLAVGSRPLNDLLTKATAPALVDNQVTNRMIRELFDRHFCGHLRRVLGTTTGPENLPLNQESVTTLFLLQSREEEKAMFPAAAKWGGSAVVGDTTKPVPVLLARDGEEWLFDSRQEAARQLAAVTDWQLTVGEVRRTPLTLEAPALFSLPRLLAEAGDRFGLAPREVVRAVRKMLHAGLLFFTGEGAGLQVCHADCRGAEGGLSATESALYDLITDRARASRMGPAQGEHLLVVMENNAGQQFIAEGQRIIDAGFLEAYQPWDSRDKLTAWPLANATTGSQFLGQGPEVTERTRYQAEAYTFETLFTDLADFAIPVDPQVILMLQAMAEREYLRFAAHGAIVAGPNCGKVVAALLRAFPTMQGINLAAYFEQTAQEVISGRKGLDFALKQFDQTLAMQGKPLVRAKATVTGRRRPRSSSAIIKTSGRPAPPQAEHRQPASDEALGPPVSPEQDVDTVVRGSSSEKAAEETAEAIIGKEERDGAEQPPAAAAEETGPADDTAPSANKEKEGAAAPPVPAQALSGGKSTMGVTAPAMEDLFDVFAEPETDTATTAPASASVSRGPESTDKQCPACGRPLELQEDSHGSFLRCSGYPACRYAQAAQVAARCPVCRRGELLTKGTPTGKTLYVCANAGCEFIAWSRPHPLPCPLCRTPYLVEKRDLSGATLLHCPKAGCQYRQRLDGTAISPAGAGKPQPRTVRKPTAPVVAASAKAGKPKPGKRRVRVVRRRK